MSWILDELREEIRKNEDTLKTHANQNLFQAHSELNRLAAEVGRRHGLTLQVNLTSSSQASEVDRYGSRNISIVVDNSRRKFRHISREGLSSRLSSLYPQASIQTAFGYEGRKGGKVVMGRERIDILAGAIHLWCEIGDKERSLLDWLFREEYLKP